MRFSARNPELVFPTARGRAMSDATMSKMVKELGIEAVPHGFRSSFRDWCLENDVNGEVAEKCLAHTVGSKVEKAYKRSDILEPRRVVMEAWGEYVAKSMETPSPGGTGMPAPDSGAGRAVRRSRGRPRKSMAGKTEQGVLFG